MKVSLSLEMKELTSVVAPADYILDKIEVWSDDAKK